MSVFSMLLSALLLQTATQPTTRDSATDALVGQLSAGDAREREAAGRKLLDAGTAALPSLEAARHEARDPDLQLRLDTLIVQIRDRVDLGASRITLKFNNAPLSEVIDALEKQSQGNFGEPGAEFNNGEAMPRVTLDLENASFWTAILKVQDEAKVLFVPQQDGWRVMRNFGQPSQISGTESGAFLVQPTMATYQRNIAYGRNMGGGGEYFTLQFQVMAEPKIRLATGVGLLQLDRAVDSNGNDLMGPTRQQEVSTGNGQNAIGCALQLKYPKNAGETIAELRGTLKISMARRTETITSDDLIGNGKLQATVEGMKFVIDPQPMPVDEANRQTVTLNIVVTWVGGATTTIARMPQSLQQMIRITDARGVPLRNSNFTMSRSDEQRSEMRLSFQSSQPQQSRGPYKLRLDVPTSFREVEVPYVMRDLKMP